MQKGLEAEQKLRDIYYNVSTGYRSAKKLYQTAKIENINVSRNAVNRWLKTNKTYSRFKPIKTAHKSRKTIVDYLGEQLQLDLISMQKYKGSNKGYNWILSGIEILSRYAFTVPVYRKTTADMTPAVKKLLKQYKDRFGVYPKNVQFDEGKEFYNVGVKSLLKKIDNINYFSTYSVKKAAVVERFNRTLKTMMWKYFYTVNSYRWIDVLQDLTDNYNNSKNRSIKMAPNDVTAENESEVWSTLYGHFYSDVPEPKFKVGNTVRISKYKNIFTKGYEANFTEEIFTVEKVKISADGVIIYYLADKDGEKILGSFYQWELSAYNVQ